MERNYKNSILGKYVKYRPLVKDCIENPEKWTKPLDHEPGVRKFYMGPTKYFQLRKDLKKEGLDKLLKELDEKCKSYKLYFWGSYLID